MNNLLVFFYQIFAFHFPIFLILTACVWLSVFLKLIYYKCEEWMMTIIYIAVILYWTLYTYYQYDQTVNGRLNLFFDSFGLICSLMPLLSAIQNLLEHISYCKHFKPLFNEPRECKLLKAAIMIWLFKSFIFFYIFINAAAVCAVLPTKYLMLNSLNYPPAAIILSTMLFLGIEHFLSLLSLNKFIDMRGLERFRKIIWAAFTWHIITLTYAGYLLVGYSMITYCTITILALICYSLTGILGKIEIDIPWLLCSCIVILVVINVVAVLHKLWLYKPWSNLWIYKCPTYYILCYKMYFIVAVIVVPIVWLALYLKK